VPTLEVSVGVFVEAFHVPWKFNAPMALVMDETDFNIVCSSEYEFNY